MSRILSTGGRCTPPPRQTLLTNTTLGRHPSPWADTPPLVRHPPGSHPSGQTPLDRHPWADTSPPGQTHHPWSDPQAATPLGRHPWTDTPGQIPHPWADTPPPRKTDTAADGTHPTGMHSCLYKFLEGNSDRCLVYTYENFGPV